MRQQGQGAMLDQATISDAVEGRYSLPKLALMRKAWQMQTGIGNAVRTALLFLLLAILPTLFLLSHLLNALPLPAMMHPLLLNIASLPLLAPWFTGLMLIGIDAIRKTPTGFARISACYRRVVPLTVLTLIATLMIVFGTLMFLLPGLYLLVGCSLALPLLVDARLSPVTALKISLQAIHHRWFDFAIVALVLLLTTLLSVPFMGLPLLLILPWQVAVIGALYCAIFRTTPVRDDARSRAASSSPDNYSERLQR